MKVATLVSISPYTSVTMRSASCCVGFGDELEMVKDLAIVRAEGQ